MSRERPPSGDGVDARPLPMITRRSFLYGSAAAIVLAACGPGDPDVEPSVGASTQSPESIEPSVADAKWYEAPAGSGYGKPPLELVSAPGSPAFPGREVRLSSSSGAFGSGGTVVFHRSDQDASAGKEVVIEGKWSDQQLVVTLPEDEPAQSASYTGSSPASGVGPYAPYRLTVQPSDQDATPVHVDIYVWGFAPTPRFEELPEEEVEA